MKIDYIKNRQDLIDRMNRLKDRPLPTLEKAKLQWAASIKYSREHNDIKKSSYIR